MGVSFEDVAAVEALHRGVIPPTANSPIVDPVLVREERGEQVQSQYTWKVRLWILGWF